MAAPVKKSLAAALFPLGALAVSLFFFALTAQGFPGKFAAYRASLTGKVRTDIKRFNRTMKDLWDSPDFATRCFNEIMFNVFRSPSTHGGWIPAKDKFFFGGFPSDYPVFSEEQYDAYAKKVAQVQGMFRAAGKQTIYLLTPMKTDILPEFLPWNFRIPTMRGAHRGAEARERLVSAFNANGVFFYDCTDDLRAQKAAGEFTVFHRGGHHWTLNAAAGAMQHFFPYFSAGVGAPMPVLTVTGQDGAFYPPDDELYSTLRGFRRMSDPPYRNPTIDYGRTLDERVYVFGTSFCTMLAEIFMGEYAAQPAFSEISFQQYFVQKRTFTAGADGGVSVAERGYSRHDDPRFVIPDVQSSDIIIIEQQAPYGILETHEKFLDCVLANF